MKEERLGGVYAVMQCFQKIERACVIAEQRSDLRAIEPGCAGRAPTGDCREVTIDALRVRALAAARGQ